MLTLARRNCRQIVAKDLSCFSLLFMPVFLEWSCANPAPRDWGLKKLLRPNDGAKEETKSRLVVALRLPNLRLRGGTDLGSDHLARHYQLDASILLTAFRGTI